MKTDGLAAASRYKGRGCQGAVRPQTCSFPVVCCAAGSRLITTIGQDGSPARSDCSTNLITREAVSVDRSRTLKQRHTGRTMNNCTTVHRVAYVDGRSRFIRCRQVSVHLTSS